MLMFIKTRQHRDIQEIFIGNVATLQRGLIFNVVTFPRGIISISRLCRDVLFQHCDVGIQRRNIVERYIFNIATLESNLTTLQRGIYFNVATLSPTSRRSRDQQPGNFYKNVSKCRKLLEFNSTPPKACTKLSMLSFLRHGNLTTLKPATQIHQN